MKNNSKLLVAIILVLTLVSTLACGAIPILTGGEEETATEKPAENEEPAATEKPVERVQLDPCSLLTGDEVSGVLGGPVEIQPAQGTGGCVYTLQSDDPSVMTQLAFSAAQGNEAKVFTLLSIGMLAGFSGDPNMKAEFEELNKQLIDLTLVEVVNRMAEMFQGTGVNVTQADGPGESALWLTYANEFYSQGTLLVVRGEEYASLTMIGGDIDTARDQLAPLVETVFDRLPPAFYVLDEDGDGEFSFEYSSEATADETEEPAETDQPLEVVNGLVWVVARSAGQVYAIDPMTNQVVATIDVGRFPLGIAVAEGNVWVVSEVQGSLWRIDPSTFEVVETFSYNGNTMFVDAGQGFVWVTGGLGLRKIDLTTGTRFDVIDDKCYDVAIGENAIWVSQTADQQLLKIDPETNEVVATVKLDGKPTNIAYGHGTVWTILFEKDEVVGVDPNTNQVVRTMSGDGSIAGLAVGPSRVYYTSPRKINYIYPSAAGFSSFPVSNHPWEMVFFAGSLWVTNPDVGLVTRINPEDRSVIAEIDLGTDPSMIAAGE